MTTTTILSDNGVSSGSAGIKTTGGNDGTLALQTTTAGGTATTAMTIDTSQNTTFAGYVNAPNTFGFKNRIINGAMGIWQRGTSFSSISYGTYAVDRFAASANTTTITRSTDTPSGANFQYSASVAQANTDYAGLYQRIESVNSYDLYTQSVTISFWAKSTAGTSSLFVALYTPTVTDNYASVNTIGSTIVSASPSSSWTYYTVTFTNLPSSVANGLQLSIARNNTSSSTTLITGVQLEKGSTATSFDLRPYGTELALCQRYYYRLKAGSTYTNAGSGRAYSTTNAQVAVAMPVSMRAAPTSTGYSALTDWNGAQASGNITAFSPASQYSADFRWMTIDITATYVAGATAFLNANNTTNAWLEWSAEL